MHPIVYLSVTVISVFSTYYLTHRNNFKVLREKWITEVRNASCELMAGCEKLFDKNTNRYITENSRSRGQNISDSENQLYLNSLNSCADAKAQVNIPYYKTKLLFKNGDTTFNELDKKIKKLIESSETPKQHGNSSIMDRKTYELAQQDYNNTVNALLNKHWNEITKSPIDELKSFICDKFCNLLSSK